MATVDWFNAIILGVVQGLTEFLPISSSAHLSIVGQFMGIGDVGAAFTAITQIGTEAAVVIIYRRKIWAILRAWFGAITFRKNYDRSDAKLGWFVILGSIPIVVLGLLFEGAIDSVFRTLTLTALMLFAFGALLGWADANAKQELELKEMSPLHAVIFGFAQALALIPGVSRSGGTITAGLLMGYTRRAAADYSFLLAIPAVLGSGFYKLFTDGMSETAVVSLPMTLVATVVAFVVAFGVIHWFLRIITTRSYAPFVFYRMILAVVIVISIQLGALQPSM